MEEVGAVRPKAASPEPEVEVVPTSADLRTHARIACSLLAEEAGVTASSVVEEGTEVILRVRLARTGQTTSTLAVEEVPQPPVVLGALLEVQLLLVVLALAAAFPPTVQVVAVGTTAEAVATLQAAVEDQDSSLELTSRPARA
jgi:hypothetical protein